MRKPFSDLHFDSSHAQAAYAHLCQLHGRRPMDISGIQGHRWVPEHPEVKTPGQLAFNPKDGGLMEAWGPRLGAPTDSTNWFFNNEVPIYFERIFGSTEQGDFTLLNCRMIQSSFSLGSPPSKQFLTCSTAIKGIHVSDTSGFRQVRAKIANLDEWASLASLMPDGNFGYKIRRNAGPTVRLQEGVTLSIQPNISNGQDRRSARIEIQNDLYLTFDSAIRYSDILPNWINPFVDLVTLATSHPSAVREFELSDSASPGTWHQVGLQLGFDPSSRSIGIWAEKTVLKYADLNSEEHFPRWYNMAHKLQGIFSNTFGARYSTGIMPENRYLNATTAAEAMWLMQNSL